MSSLSVSKLFGIKGYVAVVTGGSSGIGLMISKGLVTNGVKVYVTALASDPIEAVVAELNKIGAGSGGSAHGFACDVSSKEQISSLIAHVKEKEDHLDILISNAGVRRDPPMPCDVLKADVEELQASMWSASSTDWADTFTINTTAHFFMAVAFLPLLAAASRLGDGRGTVIITSSCASMHNMTNIDLTSYAASKAATDHLVRLLAAKFNRSYVRVVGINPGFVPSRMNPVGEKGNIFSNLFDKVPAKRAGSEEDMAGAVIYLASRAGAYVDGVSLCIDGGRILLANGQE